MDNIMLQEAIAKTAHKLAHMIYLNFLDHPVPKGAVVPIARSIEEEVLTVLGIPFESKFTSVPNSGGALSSMDIPKDE